MMTHFSRAGRGVTDKEYPKHKFVMTFLYP